MKLLWLQSLETNNSPIEEFRNTKLTKPNEVVYHTESVYKNDQNAWYCSMPVESCRLVTKYIFDKHGYVSLGSINYIQVKFPISFFFPRCKRWEIHSSPRQPWQKAQNFITYSKCFFGCSKISSVVFVSCLHSCDRDCVLSYLVPCHCYRTAFAVSVPDLSSFGEGCYFWWSVFYESASLFCIFHHRYLSLFHACSFQFCLCCGGYVCLYVSDFFPYLALYYTCLVQTATPSCMLFVPGLVHFCVADLQGYRKECLNYFHQKPLLSYWN